MVPQLPSTAILLLDSMVYGILALIYLLPECRVQGTRGGGAGRWRPTRARPSVKGSLGNCNNSSKTDRLELTNSCLELVETVAAALGGEGGGRAREEVGGEELTAHGLR